MPDDRSIDPDEARLRRLGAQWFAEVRRANPDPEPPRRRERANDGGPLDDGEGDTGGDTGGDCGGGDGD